MVFITEGFLEVAIESKLGWDTTTDFHSDALTN